MVESDSALVEVRRAYPRSCLRPRGCPSIICEARLADGLATMLISGPSLDAVTQTAFRTALSWNSLVKIVETDEMRCAEQVVPGQAEIEAPEGNG